MHKRSVFQVALVLILMCAVSMPGLQTVPSVNAQGPEEYVRTMYMIIEVSYHQYAASDDPLVIEFFNPNNPPETRKVFRDERTAFAGYFGGESGQVKIIRWDFNEGQVPRSIFNDPSNICLVARGSDGLLIDTLFILGFYGGQWNDYQNAWNVLAIWANNGQLWLDTDTRESPDNRAELDLLDGDCRHR